jgi:hypothetical protein
MHILFPKGKTNNPPSKKKKAFVKKYIQHLFIKESYFCLFVCRFVLSLKFEEY